MSRRLASSCSAWCLALAGCGLGSPAAAPAGGAPGAAARAGAKAAGPLSFTSRAQVADAELERAALIALREATSTASELDADVRDGVVMLTGTADNPEIAGRAIAAMQRLRGVRAIVDRIDVVAPLVEDADLEQAVRRALDALPALEESRITVRAERGRVTLSGSVDDHAQRALATDVAWAVRGVSDVEPSLRLRVGEDFFEASAAGRYRGDTEAARVERPDPEVAAAVRDALRFDPRVPDAGIEVSVRGGKVTLRGQVSSPWERRAAEQDALGTLGARQVENRIEVTSTEEISDADLRRAVRARLANHPAVTAEGIRVDASDGVVHLRGRVDSAFESRQAERTAAGVRGVAVVQNDLRVSPELATEREDSALRAEVEARLARDLGSDASRVRVSVEDGVVILEGTLPDWDVYDAVLQSVYGHLPRAVVNRLERERLPQRPSER